MNRVALLGAALASVRWTGALAQAVGAGAAEALPDPAAAPPAPADLSVRGSGAAVTPGAEAQASRLPAILPAGMERLAGGGLRLHFSGDVIEPDARHVLGELGRRLAEATQGRVTVLAQVAQPDDDVSVARRLSLHRARLVKQALAAGGLDPTRIDLRPLGRTAAAADLVDVLPPGAPRGATTGTEAPTR